jgi:hypothetical protein
MSVEFFSGLQQKIVRQNLKNLQIWNGVIKSIYLAPNVAAAGTMEVGKGVILQLASQ